MSSPADLPDDIAALKALVAERDAGLAHKEVVVTELLEQLSTRSAEIEHLKLWITKLQRMQFGRKSAKSKNDKQSSCVIKAACGLFCAYTCQYWP